MIYGRPLENWCIRMRNNGMLQSKCMLLQIPGKGRAIQFPRDSMKSILKAVAFVALGATALIAHASDAEIKKALKAAYPEMPEVALIKPAPVPGLYEVVVGSELIYSDAKGKFLFQGNLIQVAGKKNLTEERLQAINKVEIGRASCRVRV